LDQVAAHLSGTAQRFLEYVTSDPELMRPMHHLLGDYPAWLDDFYRSSPLQSWPTFLGTEKLGEVRRATVDLTRLVKSIPERIFRNDFCKIAAFYGIPNESLAALFLAPPNGLASALVRNDYIDTPEGLKILEVNAGSVGGWLFGYLEHHFRANPVIARFLQKERITPYYRDPLEEMLRHIITDNLGRPFTAEGVLNVVIAVDEPGLASHDARISRLYRDLLAANGLTGEVVLCPYSDLTVRQNQVWYQGGRRPVHAIVEISPQNSPEGLYRCFKMGRVSLYNGPLNPLLNDKRNLALLSEHVDSEAFTAEERNVLRRHLPWTRLVAPGAVTWQGVTQELPDLLLARREEFVIKPSHLYQGKGVAVGRRTPPDAWARLVGEAVAQGDWLAQELCSSRPYVYQSGEQGYGVYDVVWGTFCFGEMYGGGFLRMLPRDTGDGIINSHRGAAEGILFEV
jgi:hypothetical protein